MLFARSVVFAARGEASAGQFGVAERSDVAKKESSSLRASVDVAVCCGGNDRWSSRSRPRIKAPRRSALSCHLSVRGRRLFGSAYLSVDITARHASINSTMALRELGARLGSAIRSDLRPCLSAVRPTGHRNASSSPAADPMADLEDSSSFSAPPPDGEIIKTWDPVERHRRREKPLPSSR